MKIVGYGPMTPARQPHRGRRRRGKGWAFLLGVLWGARFTRGVFREERGERRERGERDA